MLHIPLPYSSSHSTMASGSKSVAFSLLFLNLLLYVIVAIISGWAINYGIDETANAILDRTGPVKLFPIYYPIGNMATGFFVIFALIAGVVGIATSLSGIQNLAIGNMSNLASASGSSIITWSLVLLAMGLACKEISIGWRTGSLRTLETMTIILSGTQLLGAGAIYATLTTTSRYPHGSGGRV